MNKLIAYNDTATTQPKSKVIRRLAGYVLQHKLLALAALVTMLTSNILALAAPKLSGLAIDAIEPGAGKVQINTVLYYCALMAVCYIVSALLSYALSVIMTILSKKIVDIFDAV
jgi:ATP-binding cassette subfamily B protein